MAAHDRAELGLRRCLQGARLWPSLTVAETLALAARHDGVAPPGLLAALTRNVDAIADESLSQQAVDQLVEQFGLEQWRQFPIQRLSTGTRQVVALATLAAGRPRVALIDEPVAGVAAHERPAIARLIRDLADTSGAGIVLVEHDHEFVEAIADRVLTLSAGRMMTPTEPTGPSKPRRTDRASF
jgi:ABC-type branched-subunit amino acid transport system ATPase component